MWRAVLGLALLLAAWGTYKVRRQLIHTWFSQGRGGAAPPPLPSWSGPGLGRANRVRVVLVDGAGYAATLAMANYRGVCARGLDLRVDVGFPTVSLPVQHELWTGLTQQQTGVLYSNSQLARPPSYSIPSQVPKSRAVSEAYQRIALSVGFAVVDPDKPKRVDPRWSLESSWRSWLSPARTGEFERVAIRAVSSDAQLVLIHVLRADAIAHKVGADSRQYRAALAWADHLIGTLIGEDASSHPKRPSRWFVLADHGHRAVGGHGGAEPAIRKVRTCISGVEHGAGAVHLVDISRAIADSLGVRLDPRSAGRPLQVALAAPAPGATLPQPSRWRWLIALAVVALALWLALATARSWWYWPLWFPVAYLSLVALAGSPTMSTKIVYNSYRASIYHAIVPGLLVLAVSAALILRMDRAWRVLSCQLVPAAAVTVAALVLCHGERYLVLAGHEPALMPSWSANASVLLAVLYVAFFVAALAMFVSVTFRPPPE